MYLVYLSLTLHLWSPFPPLDRVQQESPDVSERNKYLVQYVDYSFDDFGGDINPVYPGLCSVWRSLARSKVLFYVILCPSFWCYIFASNYQKL